MCFSLYASNSGKNDEKKKENFWNMAFLIVSNISLDEIVVFAGENGHVGESIQDMLLYIVNYWVMELEMLTD